MTKKEQLKQEQEWQAESDARTLTRHAEILEDEARHSRAKEYLKKDAERVSLAMQIANDYSKKGLI